MLTFAEITNVLRLSIAPADAVISNRAARDPLAPAPSKVAPLLCTEIVEVPNIYGAVILPPKFIVEISEVFADAI